VPQAPAKSAEVAATVKEVCSASITKGLVRALAYHWVEKPVKATALLPALKENSAITAMGR